MDALKFFAKRTQLLTDTTVVNLLKASVNPEIISFAGGIPSPKTFPVEKFRQISEKIFTKYGEKGLQYQPTQGIPQLLQTLSSYLSQKWDRKITTDNILITCGSQQGIDLLGKTFINPGDLVAVEKPCYFVAAQAFSAYKPKFIDLPFVNNQLPLNQLNKLSWKKLKLLYLNPSFQNPTGQSLAINQREELGKLANKLPGGFIIEDAAYTDLYFDHSYPDIITYSDKIIHLGTFSKILAPGLRLGYIVGPKKIIKILTLVKQSMDLHTNSFSQILVNEILTDKTWFKKHLKTIREFYQQQANYMNQFLKQYFNDYASWNTPQGGLYFWLKTRENTDNLYKIAIKNKVAFVPGRVFFAKNPQNNYLRMSFATVEKERMEQGIKRLANLFL